MHLGNWCAKNNQFGAAHCLPEVERCLAPAVHSGHVGDYTAWFVVGLAALGGLLAVAIR